jgi:hypothetical protein
MYAGVMRAFVDVPAPLRWYVVLGCCGQLVM